MPNFNRSRGGYKKYNAIPAKIIHMMRLEQENLPSEMFIELFSVIFWCRGGDSNPYRIAPTAPLTLRVYQFHHLGNGHCKTIEYDYKKCSINPSKNKYFAILLLTK